MLKCLERHGIKATFFLIGEQLLAPGALQLAQLARSEGHWLGNHTFSHRTPLGQLPAEEALSEFDRTQAAVEQTGETRRLFRPYGGGGRVGKHLMQASVVERMVELRYTCVLWNSVPGDWRDPDGWMARALTDVATRDWSLVVLHDINAAAMGHLGAFIERLKLDGYEFPQQFPPDCTPLIDGQIVQPMAGLIT